MGTLVFRATTRGTDWIEVYDDGEQFTHDRYTIKKDGCTYYADTIDGVLAELVYQSVWKTTFSKIALDRLGITDKFLTIYKQVLKKYNYLFKAEKGSTERQIYFDIGRVFQMQLARGKDYQSIFEYIDDFLNEYHKVA